MIHTYTHEQVVSASLTYFKGDELAASVFAGKYALRDEEGNYLELTPFDMHKRLAQEFARIEKKYSNPISYDEILDLLSFVDPVTGERGMGDVVPQGSPMSAIGNSYQLQSLSNCFVIPSTLDSYGSILMTDQRQIQIMKRRGGVGHDISNIRPRGMRTSNAAGTTDGIGVFMERFSNSTREVAQGGRRGALMLSIDVRAPEIETFIDIKRDPTKVTGANVSVRVTDEFMRAVEDDREFTLQWPVDVPVENAKVTKLIRARDLWNKIVNAAHERAEPGVLFWDTILKMTPSDAYFSEGFRSSSTNPCGEIPLNPWGACRLMLVDVSRFVVDKFTIHARFDFERFNNVVQKAQRLMDDLVDLELEAIDRIIAKIEADEEPEDVKTTELTMWRLIREDGVRGRRTGLGVTALGDAIAMMGMRYGMDAIDFVDDVYRGLALGAYRSSVQLAKERGAFPVFNHELEVGHPFLERVLSQDDTLRHDHGLYGRRNIALTTTAPAGSVSILTQTTSGCEPVFKRSYTRRKKINPNDASATVDFIDALGDKWQHFTVYHHGVKRWMEVTGQTDELSSPYANSASDEIDWIARVDMQAAAQRWVCHSISSTVNLPKETSVETVSELYLRAWKNGCKGVTVYRDGSRDGVLVSEKPLNSKNDIETVVDTDAPKRPKSLMCDIHRGNVKGQTYLIVIGLLNDRPYELFCGLSDRVEMPKKVKRGFLVKNGRNAEGVATYNLEVPVGDDEIITFKDIVNLFDNTAYSDLTRTISLALRHGVPVKYLVEQLRKTRNADMTSFSSVIARVLSKHYIADGTKATQEKKCTACGSTELQYQGGCVTCGACGSSKCG